MAAATGDRRRPGAGRPLARLIGPHRAPCRARPGRRRWCSRRGVGCSPGRRATATAGAAVGDPDVGRQRQAGAQAAADQEIRRQAPAPDDGGKVAEQRLAARRTRLAVAPADQQAAGARDHDAAPHQPARSLAAEHERGEADPPQVAGHQRGAAGDRGAFERGNPGGEVQGEKKSRRRW